MLFNSLKTSVEVFFGKRSPDEICRFAQPILSCAWGFLLLRELSHRIRQRTLCTRPLTSAPQLLVHKWPTDWQLLVRPISSECRSVFVWSDDQSTSGNSKRSHWKWFRRQFETKHRNRKPNRKRNRTPSKMRNKIRKFQNWNWSDFSGVITREFL